ncbi:DNA-processing protein DprA [Fuerstiella marisgermanici]|uniref:DNA protecting protein DprA n=1 Tax=Fuerstiella marisgermanici TaxID=1891926 RepID=A0A1P8WBE4_9PLAN|nr:DNA-processing protein DprA [Fuerstiella marisgermanici]APZ91375.1 DNA protecting protein DprA [Fuerstiella marisgermanici]
MAPSVPDNSGSGSNTDHDADVHATLAMSLIPGIGPRLHATLLERFETADNVLNQPAATLQTVNGVGKQLAERITIGIHRAAATEMLARCVDLGVKLRRKHTPGYPTGLNAVDDAPGILYVRGTFEPRDELAVGIVGSRRCTSYGRRQAERMAGSLVRAGFTIISGLARGIDGAAHRGALNAGGRTIAVMATGVKEIYPPEHADLAIDITRSGAVVSEFPLDQKPRPGLFPQRNRIISGMSLGVIVVEATRNSGALYTARHAMEQGREVFAVPGQVDSLASAGCHDLIREGATLIRNVEDVLAELGPLSQPTQSAEATTVHDPREMSLNPQEKEVLNLITTSPVHVDEVLRTTKLDMSRVLSTLTVLEMKRFIRRLPGNMLVRNV